MANWYVDEGLAVLIEDWKEEHPGATVYTIADNNHNQDPDVSQHAPDDGGAKPGDDKGEVDATDFMPGKGVTEDDLDELAEGLRQSEDKRILYVIRRDRIFSSVIQPFKWRPYKGHYHTHTHVSVNDLFDNNTSDWNWEKLVSREIQYVPVVGAKLPLLQFGDEDSEHDGWNHVGRVQHLLNFQEKKNPLDVDGVYGGKTRDKIKSVFGGDGRKLPLVHARKLYGI